MWVAAAWYGCLGSTPCAATPSLSTFRYPSPASRCSLRAAPCASPPACTAGPSPSPSSPSCTPRSSVWRCAVSLLAWVVGRCVPGVCLRSLGGDPGRELTWPGPGLSLPASLGFLPLPPPAGEADDGPPPSRLTSPLCAVLNPHLPWPCPPAPPHSCAAGEEDDGPPVGRQLL